MCQHTKQTNTTCCMPEWTMSKHRHQHVQAGRVCRRLRDNNNTTPCVLNSTTHTRKHHDTSLQYTTRITCCADLLSTHTHTRRPNQSHSRATEQRLVVATTPSCAPALFVQLGERCRVRFQSQPRARDHTCESILRSDQFSRQG